MAAGRGCFFFLFPPERGFVNRSQRVSPWAGRTFFCLSRCAQGRLVPERKEWRQRGRSPGVLASLLRPSRRAPGEAGRAVERGGWVRPCDPRGRRREVEAAGAREGQERPVAECPRWRGLRSGGRAGGSSNVARRPQWREQPPQRPPRQCGGAEARSLPAPRRPPARGRPTLMTAAQVAVAVTAAAASSSDSALFAAAEFRSPAPPPPPPHRSLRAGPVGGARARHMPRPRAPRVRGATPPFSSPRPRSWPPGLVPGRAHARRTGAHTGVHTPQ